MGIGTRDYARPYATGGGLPYGIKLLLIANTAVFLLQTFGGDAWLVGHFALQPSAVVSTFPAVWQLVTYMFLHGGIFHILFNMLALWMFGNAIEQVWGSRKFLQFYFTCGIGAGICIVLLNYLLPAWGSPHAVTLGASGAIYGILLASAVLWPDQIVYFNFLFPIKMKYLVMIYGGIAFIGASGGGGEISHIGHLGGLLTGWLYLKTPRRVGGVRGSPISYLKHRYKVWKLERNKRKFQVYLRKNRSDSDPWVN